MKNDDYSDIINLPHHRSTTHPPMSMKQRAAQFSPFAAVSGYGEAVTEAQRVVGDRSVLSEDKIEELNQTINILQATIMSSPVVAVTYFAPDDVRASGGEYQTITGELVKIDDHRNMLVFADGTEVYMDNIKDIEIVKNGTSL